MHAYCGTGVTNGYIRCMHASNGIGRAHDFDHKNKCGSRIITEIDTMYYYDSVKGNMRSLCSSFGHSACTYAVPHFNYFSCSTINVGISASARSANLTLFT